MRSNRLAVLVLAAATLAACFDSGSTLTFPTATVTGTSGTNASLTGAWSRTVLFVDDAGFTQSSQTRWQFNGDGTGTLTVATTNLTAGIADTTVSTFSWTTNGTTLQVALLSPSTGTITLDFAVSGDTLTLGGQPFVRRT